MAAGNFIRAVDPILKEGKWTKVEENNLRKSSVGLCVLGQLQSCFLQVPLLCLGAYEKGLIAFALPLKVRPLDAGTSRKSSLPLLP